MSDRVKERLNVDRALLLLSSLQCFWQDERPLDIFIVMPDEERKAIETSLSIFNSAENLNLWFISESAVSPKIADAPKGYGIAKHMLIKMAANRFVNSKFYIVLDSDIVACKPLTAKLLVPNGKALTHYYNPEPQAWWNGSEKVLGYPLDTYTTGNKRIFVTPEILSCDIMASLHAELEKIFGGDWISGLIERFNPESEEFWTEYTLYDLHAVKHDLFRQYHVDEGDIIEPLHCMEQSLWIPQHLESWQPVKAFSGHSPGYFLVLQSIMANDIDFATMQLRVVDAAKSAGFKFPDKVKSI